MPLSYAEVTAITYESDDMAVILTPEQQSLAVQALALFEGPEQWTDYDTYSDDIDALVSATKYQIELAEVPPPVNGQSEVNLWGHEAVVQGGGSALSRSVLTTQYHNFIVQPTTPAVNWKVRWDRYLVAGAWSYAWLWHRNTNCGIIDVYASPDSGGTVTVINDLDMRGASAPNQRTTGTFALTKAELYHIEMEVVATSLAAQYNAQFTLLQLWRTGP